MGAPPGADTPMKDSELGTHNCCLMHFFLTYTQFLLADRITLSLGKLRVDIGAPLLKKNIFLLYHCMGFDN